ncbi:sulfotransferase family protein [Parvicella tangerina]|uniref:Sulfotransferase n=1 Tax=Parvicella tangerina TaxID=2829795 RepID=A0A916JM73_9FLAO|nr:sulfotransferase [Parvicella tangerina]CAG5081029.1 hypothetical protein CRYO30217_01517 [Parvicella tangerina]
MKRIFIVGIARSGTTLLQSMIGNHPEICTFPETHFFSATLPKQKILRFLHKITPDHKELVRHFFEENRLNGYKPYSGNSRDLNQWVKHLTQLMDNIAISNDQNCWLEKTPMHLYFIDLIEKNTDNCFFIHTIRDPKANIAALFDVSKKHPNAFKQTSLKKAINRYIKEIYISERYLKRQNHLHVYYEDLVEQPKQVMTNVFNFLDLSFKDKEFDYRQSASSIISQDETWKANNTKELKLIDKVKERLTIDEVKQVEEALVDYEPSLLARYDQN